MKWEVSDHLPFLNPVRKDDPFDYFSVVVYRFILRRLYYGDCCCNSFFEVSIILRLYSPWGLYDCFLSLLVKPQAKSLRAGCKADLDRIKGLHVVSGDAK